MNLQWRAALSAYAPLVIWIALILFFSGSRGSVDETSGFFRPLLEFFFPSASPEELIRYYGFLRKVLHFVVYAILGLLADRALSSTTRSPKRTVVISLLTCLAVSATDEYVQSHDPSRTGTGYDVMLDMAGATIAVAIMYLLNRRRPPGEDFH